jgi:Cof subfamily protein (haloacid dehalogenase superfamily)
MPYKLVALDIDGTLYNSDKAISPRTRQALIDLQQRGVIVALASGRPVSGIEPIAEALDLEKHHGLIVAYNGGRVIDATSRTVLYEQTLPLDLSKRLLRHLAALPVTPIVDDGRDIVTDNPDGFHIRFECAMVNLGLRVVGNLAEDLDFEPVKILIAAPAEVLGPTIPAIEAPFAGELGFVLSTPYYLEALLPEVSKADGLKVVCDRLGIAPSEVMAFGDAPNDLTMIEFAGLGVAMGNACPELKAAANTVTLTNDDDGIAHMLAQHFG